MKHIRQTIAVVGAGFFGLSAAAYLANKGFGVEVFERNDHSMTEASRLNQARVHGGYHYPRALQTAARCRVNYSRFHKEFSSAIGERFLSTYAIAQDSKVSAVKFEKFAQLIGAPLHEMPKNLWNEFDPRQIERGWIVEETAFDATKLRDLLLNKLSDLEVKIHYGVAVASVKTNTSPNVGGETASLTLVNGERREFYSAVIATYGQKLDNFSENPLTANLLFEICELVSIRPPSRFEDIAVTVMDGPYWSMTPWPAFDSSVLTHVRFTPHTRFSDPIEAQEFLESGAMISRADLMIRDASRYLPLISQSQILESKYVIKAILPKRDYDDARPVIYGTHQRVLSIVGSKIDNIYELEPVMDDFLEGLAHGR